MEARIETILTIEKIRVKAYHGWYEAERKIGGMYSISVKIYDSSVTSETFNEMDDSVNYEDIYDVVVKTMKEEYKLIETCCKSLWDRLKELRKSAVWEVLLEKEDVPMKYVGQTTFTIKG
ncbi:MAG: dihydroneopterin aldolase [Bacteroidia bacterium]